MAAGMFTKGRVVKRWTVFVAVIFAVGCGVGSRPGTTPPTDETEPVPLEPSPGVVPPFPSIGPTDLPIVNADPPTQFPDPVFFHAADGSVDILGVLLNALLVDLLAPSGPRLNDSMTFLERLCLEGDEPDSFCRQRFSR